jgi:predicted RNA binding protein YcfA (HicA-like mRNA interferase family)
MKFSEMVRLLERNGFELVREKGSVRYYAKAGLDRLVRLDYHGSKEIPAGTCEQYSEGSRFEGQRHDAK